MNPALLVILLLCWGAWAARRRWRDGAAVAGVGLAMAVLLGPALVIPDGMPSPAATLGHFPPWQGELDPSRGNPNLRDVTHQIQPWLLHLRREWRQGRPPLWNPHQFAGAPFWANGQSAPLFPLHLLFSALPLALGWVLLPWLKGVVAGWGTWRLARELGVGPPGALAAAVAFPLSGMLVNFLLFPMGNALALVPWALWATERLAKGASGGAALALVAGLQMLAGHPETALHTGLLCAVYLAARGVAAAVGRAPILLRFVGAWLVGAAVAAVQLLPLFLHLLESTKWATFEAHRAPLGLAFREMLRVVLPGLYGHPVAGTFWGPVDYAATAVYAGAAALPLAAVGLGRARREGPWRGVAALLAVSGLVAYHLPGLWDLLVHLPLYSKVLHHRLIFGVELGLALALGAGWERWRAGEGRRALAVGSALALGLLAVAWALFVGEWAERGLLAGRAGRSLAVVGVVMVLALPWRRLGTRLGGVPRVARAAAWVLAPLLVVDLALAHAGLLPGLSRQDFYPETGAVTYLASRPGRVAGTEGALHPNAALVYGLHDIRGDDPVKARRTEEIYARLAPTDPVYFRPVEVWTETDLLDRLAVRWVVTGPGEEPPPPARLEGWKVAWQGPDARVWERLDALPLVRPVDGEPDASPPRVVDRRSGRWLLEVEGGEADRGALEIAEIWHPGWRQRHRATSTAADEEAPWSAWRPVAATEDGFLRVAGPTLEVRTGDDRQVELVYRAPGLLWGAVLSLLGMVGVVVLGVGRAGRVDGPS